MDAAVRADLIGTLRRFLTGEGNDWEWDDFLSVPQRDPEARKIQGFSLQLRYDYPPCTHFDWCNDEGKAALWEVVKQLESPSGKT